MKTLLRIISILGIVFLSGCVTARWAQEDDWRKKTGWQDERTDNPGLWSLLSVAGSLVDDLD